MRILDKLIDGFIYFNMPVVLWYHLVSGNVFLNTAAEDAVGLEAVANISLAPVQYLLCGDKAVLEKNGDYRLEQRYSYDAYFPVKFTASIVSLPVSLPTGVFLKGLAFLSQETKERHHKIAAAKKSTKVEPNIDYYKSLGLKIDEDGGFFESLHYQRRPGAENALVLERELVKEIISIFNQNQIPFWLDCGSCLGAYRYGGAIPWDFDIDLAVLLPDFDNIRHALNALDTEKYCVEDWSNRRRPKSYIRVYIKETRNYIDIYHFDIDPERKKLTYLLSNEISPFMTEGWKIRERRFTVPSDYSTIFPLKKTNFDGIEAFVPNNIVKYLQERYGENLAPSRIYDEKTGEYEKDLNHPYWQLPNVH